MRFMMMIIILILLGLFWPVAGGLLVLIFSSSGMLALIFKIFAVFTIGIILIGIIAVVLGIIAWIKGEHIGAKVGGDFVETRVFHEVSGDLIADLNKKKVRVREDEIGKFVTHRGNIIRISENLLVFKYKEFESYGAAMNFIDKN